MRDQEHTTGRTSRRARRAGLIAAIAVAGVALALAAAAALIPRERIARAAAARAEAVLGTEVAIGGLALDFWPVPAVALEAVRIGRGDSPLATVERVRLRPRLIPLLFGRVVVDELALERPRLVVAVDSAGRGALPAPAGAPADEPPAPVPASGATAADRGVEFAVHTLRIDDGRIIYRDARDGTAVRLAGIEQELALAGELRAGELAHLRLTGTLSVDSVDAMLPGRFAAPVRAMPVAIEHDATLDRAADRLTLDRLRVELAEVSLEGEGRVVAVSDSTARRVAITLRTDPFDVARLLRSLPAGLLGSPPSPGGGAGGERALPDVAGRAAVRVRLDGPATRDSMPRVDGAIELDGVAITYEGRPALEALSGTIAFSRDSAAARELRGRVLGEPFRAAFTIRNFAAPVLAFDASGALSLERAAAIAALGDSLALAGRLPFDLRGRLPASDPGSATLDGEVGLAGARAAVGALRRAVEVEAGRVVFDARALRLAGLRLDPGDGALTVDATVDGWLAAALGDTASTPSARFDLRAGALDLDALLGPSESDYPELLFARLAGRSLDGRTATEAAEARGLALPPLPPLEARGRVRVERLARNGLEYRDVDAEVVVSSDSVAVPHARFGFLGGSVELALTLHPEADGARLAVDYTVTDVGARAFFSRLTPLRQNLAGTLRLDGSARALLDAHLLPVREGVRARGTVALRDGRLANWPLLRAVGDRLDLAGFDTLDFRDWTGAFRVEGARTTIERSVQTGARLDADVAGWFDFGGRLDLDVLAHLPRDLAARAARPIREVIAAAADSTDRVPVGLHLGGSAGEPDVALDLTVARRAIVARGREAARREAGELAERAVEEVTERAGLDSLGIEPGALPERLDSLGVDPATLDSLGLDSLVLDRLGLDSLRVDSMARSGAESLLDRARGALPFLRRRVPPDTTAPDTIPPDTIPPDTTRSRPTPP